MGKVEALEPLGDLDKTPRKHQNKIPYVLLLIIAGAVGGQIHKIKKENKNGLS